MVVTRTEIIETAERHITKDYVTVNGEERLWRTVNSIKMILEGKNWLPLSAVPFYEEWVLKEWYESCSKPV